MKTLLFNPGPTNVSEGVRNALKTNDICHREPEFQEVLLRVNKNIVLLLGGEGDYSAVLFVASGTGANEAICAATHGQVLLINNGKYSDRLSEILERHAVPTTRLTLSPRKPINFAAIEKVLQEDAAITHIFAVHHETTTGFLLPLRQLGALAKKYNKLLCVDGVSSIGGHAFNLKQNNIALCSVSANKGLQSFPGVSFVICQTDEIKKLKGKSRSFYFDLYKQWEKEQAGETPFTPAVQLIFALDVALQEWLQEGTTARVQRYQQLAARMRAGLAALGFELVLFPEASQSNILTTIKMPPNMDYWQVHDELKKRGITIYSDKDVLAKRLFRVATLGNLATQDVDWFLKNLAEVMHIKEKIPA